MPAGTGPVAGAQQAQPEPEVGVVVDRVDLDGARELGAGRREPAAPEVGAAERLADRTLVRLEVTGPLEHHRGGVGVGVLEESAPLLERLVRLGGVGVARVAVATGSSVVCVGSGCRWFGSITSRLTVGVAAPEPSDRLPRRRPGAETVCDNRIALDESETRWCPSSFPSAASGTTCAPVWTRTPPARTSAPWPRRPTTSSTRTSRSRSRPPIPTTPCS